MPARSFPSTVLRRGIYPVFAMLAVTPWCGYAARHRAVAVPPFARAEQLRDALEAKPEMTRRRIEYERVLDAYRVVYHRNPGDPKASSAVNIVAGLLAEEGRVFHHAKSSEDAIGQFEFLREQYPASPYHQSALLAEAGIYLHDLHDRGSAKSAFQKFLADYPDSPLAAQAQAGLKEARHKQRGGESYAQNDASNGTHAERENVPAAGSFRDSGIGSSAQSARPSTAPQPVFSATPGMAPRTTAPSAATRANGAPTGAVSAPRNKRGVAYENELTRLEGNGQTASETMPQAVATPPADAAARTSADSAEGKPLLTGEVRVAAQQHHGRLPLVTNVRHWSTPVYTRVAIDLQEQVQYEAARVPNPDRIYFDLHGARIAPELIGKTVNVTDDGFLQRIRVAQFSNDVTRIVLDVSQVSEYSAFFLPNPWRLIIDIHGRRPGTGSQQIASAPAAPPAPAPVVRQPEPVMTAQQTSRQPTAQATRQANQQATQELRDIASLGTHTDQVKATPRPTTAPIAANVGKRPVETRVVEDGDADPPDTSHDTSHDTAHDSATEPPRTKQQRRSAGKTTTDDALTTPPPSRGETASSGIAGDDDADATPPRTTSSPSSTSREARSTIDGQRSLTRALGLKIGRIVVDAGHGGHDSGTLGPGGIQEKDVVLDVSLRLGKLLHQRMGAEVTYTRDDDTFIPLEQRTAIANKAQADLFISVHANSSSDPTARGVETYYLNFTTSPDALEVAARENAVSDQSVHELSGLVKKITLKDKIDESREFAADVEDALYTGLERDNPGMRDRGVKKAPFVVLIGANMPSILAEISFLTNPSDASELKRGEYRQRIAESLYRGVAKYVSGLSGLRVAQNTHAPGQ